MSPPPPSPLAPIKIQNGDIMVPTNPVPPGKWPFRMEREGEGQRKMTGLLCITSCHTITLFMIPFLAIMHKMMKSLPTQFLQNARPFAFLFHPTYLVTAKHISVSQYLFSNLLLPLYISISLSFFSHRFSLLSAIKDQVVCIQLLPRQAS